MGNKLSDEAHHAAVDAFFAECQLTDSKKYDDVCAQYPVLTRGKQMTINRKERNAGLVGLQPCYVSADVAARHGVESVYAQEEDN